MIMINVDGPDGAGKSTLVRKLITYYTQFKKKVDYIHFPRYNTNVGAMIKDVLYGYEKMDPMALQMLYSVDRLNFTKNVLPVLEESSDMLIVDRYTTSGIVYGLLDGIDPKIILANEKNVRKPDIHIILTGDTDVLMSRLNRQTDIFETSEKLARVNHYYKKVNKYLRSRNLINIDTTNLCETSVFYAAVLYLEMKVTT